MYLSKEEREELSSLCKEIYGTRNYWQKMLEGVPELITRQTVETIPGENGAEATTKEITMPVLAVNGTKQYTRKSYTIEEIKTHLITLKTQRDEMIATINKQNEEKKAKAEQDKMLKNIQNVSSGSAL